MNSPEWRGPVTAEELIGADAGRILGNAPIAVRREESEDGTHFEALIERGINGSGLLQLLSKVSPRKDLFRMDSLQVDADWRMPDMAKATTDDSENQRLLALHEKGLGKLWALFQEHRKLFLEVLNYREHPAPFHRIQGRLTVFESQRDVEEHAPQKLRGIQGRSNQIAALNTFFVQNPGERAMMIDALQHKKRKGRHGIHLSFSQWSDSEIEELFRYMCTRVKGAELQAIVQTQMLRHAHPFLHPTTNERIYVYESNLGLQLLGQASNQGEMQDGRFTGRLELKPHDERTLEMIVHIIAERREATMRPLISWKRDPAGMRHWEHTSPAPLPAEDSPHNSLSGLLAVASMGCETLVKQWPDRMGLPGGRYMQNVGEAQMPVLLMMKAHDIVNHSPLLPALERYAEKATQDESAFSMGINEIA